jgi:outer membrane protein OmpA-like peptidoglycan-associated protein
MLPDEIRRFQKELNAIHSDTVFLVTRAIMFKANSAEILPASEEELERLYNQIDDSGYDLRIVGHTASVGAASAQYRLSLERAEAVKDYLVERGISGRRLKVAGMGGSRPVADNDSNEGKARNRRVEFVIIE